MENSKDDKKPKSQPSKVTKKVKTPLTPEQKRSRSLRTSAVLLILMAFLAGVIGGAFGARLLPERITSLDNSSSGQKIVSSQSDLISKIAKDVSPSVVSINVESSTQQKSVFGDIS